jgi:NADH-quinone oxidoreductase subunit A
MTPLAAESIVPDAHLAAYLPILILTVLVVAMAFGIILLSHLVGPRRHDPVKLQAYESGMPSVGGRRPRLSIQYYLMAILFLVFDVEVTFLYPWALVYRRSLALGTFILLEMVFFFLVLLAGYVYGWREGAYDWGSSPPGADPDG